MDTQAPILPKIHGLSGKMMALTRRKEHLEKQINERRGSEGSLQFATIEKEALEAALDAMRYHRSVVEGMDRPLELLREVVETQTVGPDISQRIYAVLDDYEA